jgi:hypothetical protein
MTRSSGNAGTSNLSWQAFTPAQVLRRSKQFLVVSSGLLSLTSAMWERTLQDLIRGLWANKNDECKFISQAMDEIRRDIGGKDMELKAGVVMKLAYVRCSYSTATSFEHDDPSVA